MMRDREARLDEVFRRADVIQRRQAVKRKLVSSAAGAGIFAVILVFLLATLPQVGMQASSGSTWRYGGLLLNGSAGGYILVAVVALALGVCVALLCGRLRELKALDREKEDKP